MTGTIEAALHVACPYCRVDPPEPCRTSGGQKARLPHYQRESVVRPIWFAGYVEGLREAIQLEPETARRQLAFFEKRREGRS